MSKAAPIILLLPALVLLAGLAPGAEPPQSVSVDPFLGVWEGSGELMGSPSRFRMEWERVLGGRFYRLTFSNNSLNAQAFYRPAGEGTLEGTWFDSRGAVVAITLTEAAGTLTALWGDADSEQGKTVYVLSGPDSIEVEDFVRVGDEWRRFGQATYRRVP